MPGINAGGRVQIFTANAPTEIFKVADAAARLALTPSDGMFVLQLDTDEIWVYDAGTASWIRIALPLSGAFAAGSVIFSDGSTFTEDNTNLFFDDALNVLKVQALIELGSSDSFARKQIWNNLTNSILRQGSWQADGDATSKTSEGIVVYGASIVGGVISPAEGSYARIKNDRFGFFSIDPATSLAGAYTFRVDNSTMFYRANDNSKTFEVTRATGNVFVGSLTASQFVKTDASKNLVSSPSVSLTSEVTGVLPIANGGTNNAGPFTAGSVIFSDGTSLIEDNAKLFFDNALNLFGIGTNTPSSPLHIKYPGAVTANGVAFITLENTDGTSNDTFGIDFINTGFSGSARINCILDPGGASADLDFQVGGAAPSSLLFLSSANRVGILTQSPTASLDVNGTTRLRGLVAGIVHSDGSGNLSSSAVALASEVSGILPMANGGTNKNMTASAGAVAYSDADSLELSAVGNAGEMLVSGGAGAPTWTGIYVPSVASQTVNAADTISITATIWKNIRRIAGNAAAVTVNATTGITAGTIDGQEVDIMGTSDTNTVTIESAGNVAVNGSCTLGQYDCITLQWYAADSKWIEKSRSD